MLEKSVAKNDDGTWDFRCPGPVDSLCGVPGGERFKSTGWPSKKVALARGQQHFDEHRGKKAMPQMHHFMAEHGLTTTEQGEVVRLEDLA
jgi:hypothetical protein